MYDSFSVRTDGSMRLLVSTVRPVKGSHQSHFSHAVTWPGFSLPLLSTLLILVFSFTPSRVKKITIILPIMSTPKPQKRKLSDSNIDLPHESIVSPPPYSEKPAFVPSSAPLQPHLNNHHVSSSHDQPQESPQRQGDDKVASAAEVLTQLAHSPPPNADSPSSASGNASPLSTTSVTDAEPQQHPIVQLVSAVSKLPIVTNALSYYETSKRNYAPFNYAAEFVERAAMPVFNKIEVNLNSMYQAKLEEARRKKKRRVEEPGKSNLEIKKRLKFCLHILKLANDNINSKVNCLQQAIQDHEDESRNSKHQEQLSTPVSDEKTEDVNVHSHHEAPDLDSSLSTSVLNQSHVSTQDAQETKTEIVTTVKKIIHVISNFRPSALCPEKGPETDEKVAEDIKLKSTIREIILNLPTQIQQNGTPQTNDKIVIFAKESLNMIGRLTTVLNDQLHKAESWVDGVDSAAKEDVVRDETRVEGEAH